MVTQVHSRTDEKGPKKCCLFGQHFKRIPNNQTLCKVTISGKIRVYPFLS